jgi:hypothetical protein
MVVSNRQRRIVQLLPTDGWQVVCIDGRRRSRSRTWSQASCGRSLTTKGSAGPFRLSPVACPQPLIGVEVLAFMTADEVSDFNERDPKRE